MNRRAEPGAAKSNESNGTHLQAHADSRCDRNRPRSAQGMQNHQINCLHQRLQLSSHARSRSEEHTSELQSHSDLVCRLLLEKKKKTKTDQIQCMDRCLTG